MLKQIGIVSLLFLAVSSVHLYDISMTGPITAEKLAYINGEVVSIYCKRSQAYMDGRATTGSNVLMTRYPRAPVGVRQLEWEVKVLPGDIYTFKSVSSGCYLDGRNVSGQPLLVSCRDPPDVNLQWKLVPTEFGDYWALKSVSSGCYADGRANAGDTAYASCRDFHGDGVFYFQMLAL